MWLGECRVLIFALFFVQCPKIHHSEKVQMAIGQSEGISVAAKISLSCSSHLLTARLHLPRESLSSSRV